MKQADRSVTVQQKILSVQRHHLLPLPSILRKASILATLATPASFLLLSGCGIGTEAEPDPIVTSTLITGRVHGGQQPISGAHVTFFAASASSTYGGSVSPILTTTTDSNGDFAFNPYQFVCGGNAYLVAVGGNPGTTAGTDNSAAFMVAALGSCGTLYKTPFVDISEVTTVAAAYALSGFAPVGGAGMTEAAVVANTAMPGFTGSPAGLNDAFGNAVNIVNLATGLPNAVTSASGSVGVIPQSTINTLADILQPCVNSTSPSSDACTKLFATATPPSTFGIAAPVNVFQAALDIAQYPGNNVTALYNLISTTPAFAPVLSAAPSDWTIGIVYPDPQLNSAQAMAIDTNDNIWVASSLNAELLEYSPLGVPRSPTTTSGPPSGAPSGTPSQSGWAQGLYVTTTGGNNFRGITFDTLGNVWLSDGGGSGVYEYTIAGQSAKPTQGTMVNMGYTSVDANTNNVAIASDSYGNIWTSSYADPTCSPFTGSQIANACELVEFASGSSSGSYNYVPYATFRAYPGNGNYVEGSPAGGGSRGIAVDNSKTGSFGNIWYTDSTASVVALFKAGLNGGANATASGGPMAIPLGTSDNTYGVALDKNSNAWVVGSATGGLYEIGANGTQVGTEAVFPGFVNPTYDVIDGNNNVFVANPGTAANTTAGVVEYSIAASTYLSPNFGFSPGSTYVPVNGSTPASYSGSLLYRPNYIAVDRAGAIWVLNSGTYSASNYNAALVQILGVAAPTLPYLGYGQYGVKP
jgi:hypothetical protein